MELGDAIRRVIHWPILLPVAALAGGVGLWARVTDPIIVEPAFMVAGAALALLAARFVADTWHGLDIDTAHPEKQSLTPPEVETPFAKAILKIVEDAHKSDLTRIERQIATQRLDFKERRRYYEVNPSEKTTANEEIRIAEKNIGIMQAYYAKIIPEVTAYIDLGIEKTQGPFRASLATALPYSTDIFVALLDRWIDSPASRECGAFDSIRTQVAINRVAIAMRESKGKSEQIYIDTHEASAEDKISQWLRNTPLRSFFLQEVPYGIDNEIRYAGMHIVAPPRRGKTQALQAMIMSDLEMVERGEASIVVMNSDMDLIRNVIELKRFAPGQSLDGKLIFIEPDVIFPLALNLFAMGKHRAQTYNANQKEAAINATIDMFEYMFASLLDTSLTSMQRLAFRMAVRACMDMPDANMATLQKLLLSKEGEWKTYAKDFSPPVLAFFQEHFDDRTFRERRSEIGWRMHNLFTNKAIGDLIAARECKLDLYTELLSAKVIVIHTNKAMLGEKQCELFGRLFIALVLRAVQERTFLDRAERTPTFFYIDECHDCLRDDTSITTLIEQCRKQNVGMILANQRLTQLDASLPAISNVAIKLANGEDEAPALAARLKADSPSDVMLPVGQFLASIRDVTNKPIVLKVPGGVMEREPKSTQDEQRMLRERMRALYCTNPDEAPPDVPPPDDDMDISPH